MEGQPYKPYGVGEEDARRVIDEYDHAEDIVVKSQIYRTMEHKYSSLVYDNNINHPLAIEILNRMIDCERRLSADQLEKFNNPDTQLENKKRYAQITFPRRRKILIDKLGIPESDPLIQRLDEAINTKF